MLVDLSVKEFVSTVASSSPAPGGGSCASLASSIGCSLASMLCQLTFGKKTFEERSEQEKNKFQEAFALMEKNAKELEALIDEDTSAFNQIMEAFKRPKETDEEKQSRSAAIQSATWNAIKVPLRMSDLSLNSLESMEILIEYGNANAISDLGVGILLLNAGLKGANMNVKINLASVKDKEKSAETLAHINANETRADEITKDLTEKINEKLA